MKMIKRALAIAAIVLTSFSASASLINVGGVVWDPDKPFLDFSGGSLAIYQQLDLGTGELSGYGRVSSINGSSLFCPDCELTFHFDGYILADSEASPLSGDDYFTGGSMKFWVDKSPEIFLPGDDPADATNLTLENTGSDGGINELWLELVGHILDDDPDTGDVEGEGITFVGHTDGTGSVTGTGALDVIGGLAAGNIVSGTQINAFGDEEDPIITFSDFTFGSTFSKFFMFPTGGTPIPGVDDAPDTPTLLAIGFGGATFAADSIPEPSTLAIFAFGIIALAFRMRNK